MHGTDLQVNPEADEDFLLILKLFNSCLKFCVDSKAFYELAKYLFLYLIQNNKNTFILILIN